MVFAIIFSSSKKERNGAMKNIMLLESEALETKLGAEED